MALTFEWDDEKARDNFAKHGVSFELAQRLFRDFAAIEFLDDRHDYGEDRIVRIGKVEGAVLLVVYTERNDNIRIISARRALKNEQDFYVAQSLKGPAPHVGTSSRRRRARRS